VPENPLSPPGLDHQRSPSHQRGEPALYRARHAGALEQLTAWIDTYRLAVEQRHRRLDAVLEALKEEEQS
jgi:hypothetical protein